MSVNLYENCIYNYPPKKINNNNNIIINVLSFHNLDLLYNRNNKYRFYIRVPYAKNKRICFMYVDGIKIYVFLQEKTFPQG